MLKKFIKSMLTKLFRLLGYDVSFMKIGLFSLININKYIWEPFSHQNDKMNLYNEGLKKSNVEWSDSFVKQLRYYSLQQMVGYVFQKKLIGDFVECGVWKGHSAYIISSILSQNNFNGNFHIFDSFEGGLSEKDEEDRTTKIPELTEKQIKREKELFSSTEHEVKSCLNKFSFINYYKGWIPTRFNEIENKKIAFLHIDVDLYEPYQDSLKFFYPRLVDNGVIVCDDYGLSQFPGAKKAVDEFLAKNSYQLFYEVPMGGCFIIK